MGGHPRGSPRDPSLPPPPEGRDGPVRVGLFREQGDELAVVSWPLATPCPEMARLTAAERIVIELAARGLPTESIARLLDRAPRTVTNQASAGMRKLGARSRFEVAARLGRVPLRQGGGKP